MWRAGGSGEEHGSVVRGWGLSRGMSCRREPGKMGRMTKTATKSDDTKDDIKSEEATSQNTEKSSSEKLEYEHPQELTRAQKIGAALLNGVRNHIHTLLPLFFYGTLALVVFLTWPTSAAWALGHLPLTFLALFPLFLPISRGLINHQRKQFNSEPKNLRNRLPKELLPPFRQASRDWMDLTLFLETPTRRITYAALLAVTVVLNIINPVGRDPQAPLTSIGDLVQGWDAIGISDPLTILAILSPFVLIITLAYCLRSRTGQRDENIKMIYNLASTHLNYPIKQRVRPDERPFQNARTAVKVMKWANLTDPEVFWVSAPLTLDASDSEPWQKLQVNLEKRLLSKTGWHFDHDKTGRGATISPASYPMAVKWEGQQDPDPLTFLLGADLDNPGELLTFTFGETSPMACTVGATGSGKTSVVEAKIAQAATKPMPWSDPDDPIYASTVIIDPKGPFANRWEGRPNILAVNGTRDTVDENGDPISGIENMTRYMEYYVNEMHKRGKLIDDMGITKWLDVPDDVKRRERMAPWFLVLDEYLDHTEQETGKSEQVDRDNTARQILVERAGKVARKGRSFGFHMMIIAQQADMTSVGKALMRQLVARTIMGNMDIWAYKSFFGTTDVPMLPTTRINDEGKRKGIPGRGRIQNSTGGEIQRLQAFWFGGDNNDESLNKFLPRTNLKQVEGAPVGELAAPSKESQSTAAPTFDFDDDEDFEDNTPEPQQAPKKPASPKPTGEVKDAEDLFSTPEDAPLEEDEPQEKEPSKDSPATSEERPVCSVEDCQQTGIPCSVEGCPNYTCNTHGHVIEPGQYLCEDHYKNHPLTRHGLGTLFPWARNQVERAGGNISWEEGAERIDVTITLSNVEIVSIQANGKRIQAMDGDTIVTGARDTRSMITKALKSR